MRLIDADVENGKLLDFVAEHDTAIQYAIEHKDRGMLEDIFSEYFETQKIAYGVEEVLEQLEDSAYWTQCTFDEDGYSNDDSEEVIELQKAIEIVKSGMKG